MKSGNLNFLEPSGPLQACNRIALPFTLLLISHYYHCKLLSLIISQHLLQRRASPWLLSLVVSLFLEQTKCSFYLLQCCCHLVGSAVLYYMLGTELFQYVDAALFLQPKPVPHREHSNTNNPGNRVWLVCPDESVSCLWPTFFPVFWALPHAPSLVVFGSAYSIYPKTALKISNSYLFFLIHLGSHRETSTFITM